MKIMAITENLGTTNHFPPRNNLVVLGSNNHFKDRDKEP
jgi:hypothetical protein